jgi:D-3-phosphoglycerate dehydrogenase
VPGTDREALLAALPEAAAVIVRSATRIDAEALDAGSHLQVVARAGVGVGVDIKAATDRGVLVVNAPTANVISAAEQAVTLLLAVSRHTVNASTALREGQWQRARFVGVEIAGKTVGVIGLGRVGVLFAQRMAAFGARLIGYDPYTTPESAARVGVSLVSLDQLLARSDFISLHIPRTPETTGILGAEEFTRTKPGVRIINTARGGLIDEEALAAAIIDGRVAGAGIDVYATEPCVDSPLFTLDSVVATPHLGASTAEAQSKAGVMVAESVRQALQGEPVADAVNEPAGRAARVAVSSSSRES